MLAARTPMHALWVSLLSGRTSGKRFPWEIPALGVAAQPGCCRDGNSAADTADPMSSACSSALPAGLVALKSHLMDGLFKMARGAKRGPCLRLVGRGGVLWNLLNYLDLYRQCFLLL